ncbi:hypothetical protein [Streptomyces sp. Ac-502]|uniref:hypothetical protein n=1 Tax=Streptomyces sp. Ac-502 TaxID=3342801 RepID=UPI003862BD86
MNHPKSMVAEILILAVSGGVGASLALQLAEHGVGIAAIVCAVCAVVAAGVALAAQVGQGLRTTVYTCPAKGCRVSIRAVGTSPEELQRLRDLATDHGKHGGTR